MKHKDKSWLREKYIDEDLSCTQVAEHCEVGRTAVHRALKRFNIERDSKGYDRFEGAKYRDKAWLEKKYHDEGLTYREIAEICDVTKDCIYQNAKKVGLDTSSSLDERYKDESWFREHYLERDKTLQQISDECDVVRQTVMDWRKRHDIPVQYPTGENNPNTKPNDECVTRKRGQDWHKQRRRALERADYTCENPDCDEDADSLGQNPDVHHIVPYRFNQEYGEVNNLSNLVVLCRSCHNKAEPSPEIYA